MSPLKGVPVIAPSPFCLFWWDIYLREDTYLVGSLLWVAHLSKGGSPSQATSVTHLVHS